MTTDTFALKVELLMGVPNGLRSLATQANVALTDSYAACRAFAEDDREGAVTAALETSRVVLEGLARDLQLKSDEIRDCLAE